MSSQAQQTSSSAATATTTENDAESSSNAAANNFPTNRIFIGNLATELEEFTIYKYCSAYGEITKCQVMKEPKTERSRGFGFITYAQCSSALAILNARPHYIGHHKINVKPAFPTSEV
jgi:RNA recognition motif-containing protein